MGRKLYCNKCHKEVDTVVNQVAEDVQEESCKKCGEVLFEFP